MPAGRDVLDALECVLSVYFSNVRHHNRAAFLLCDELVEVACKAKMKLTHPNVGRIGFYQLLQHATVNLDPTVAGSLGETLYKNHETRNQMQHAVAAATVDDQHCADAILDAVDALEHCFAGTLPLLSDGIKNALRVMRVHSSRGTQKQRADFDEEMRKFKWNSPLKRATGTTLPMPVGARQYWGYVIMSNNVIVAGILDQIGAP
jgi:hypothetical protein